MNRKKISSIKEIASKLQKSNKKIVFTNGCFDLLHKGHVDYLQKAKSFGDVLVVAINSDRSVKKLKGPNRPFVKWKDRAAIISSLEPVDYVLKLDDDTPEKLIKKIKPDIHVKGGDYKSKENLPEHDAVVRNGGKVKIVKFVKGYSTSNLVRQIVQSKS